MGCWQPETRRTVADPLRRQIKGRAVLIPIYECIQASLHTLFMHLSVIHLAMILLAMIVFHSHRAAKT